MSGNGSMVNSNSTNESAMMNTFVGRQILQIPSYFGYGASPVGVAVANGNRQLIEAKASGCVDPIALAAGIAVQSPGDNRLKDWLGSRSRGVGQISAGETEFFPSGTTYDPYNLEWSIEALNNKMNAAAGALNGAARARTDLYLLMAIAQNSAPPLPPLDAQGRCDWDTYFSEPETYSWRRPDVRVRAAACRAHNWRQFQLRAFVHALEALSACGWALPAGVDMPTLQILAEATGSGAPSQ
jgi:hypothetical protein